MHRCRWRHRSTWGRLPITESDDLFMKRRCISVKIMAVHLKAPEKIYLGQEGILGNQEKKHEKSESSQMLSIKRVARSPFKPCLTK